MALVIDCFLCVDVQRILLIAQHFSISLVLCPCSEPGDLLGVMLGRPDSTFSAVPSTMCVRFWFCVSVSSINSSLPLPFYRNFFKSPIHQCNRLNVCAHPFPVLDLFMGFFQPTTIFLNFSLSVITRIQSVTSPMD